METVTPQHKEAIRNLKDSDLYDLYAPAVYGNILRIVPQVPIANNILEKVFMNAFRNRMNLHSSLRSPLVTLLNESRNRTQATIDALLIFRECCAGASVSAVDKK